MRSDYKLWLERQKYDAGTIIAQLHRTGRVEKHYGDLDDHYARDRLESVIATLRYSTDDQRRGRPNPSKIPFEGDTRNNLASYKNAVERCRRFRNEGADFQPDSPAGPPTDSSESKPTLVEEDLGQRIGLERDMQAALRKSIDQLEDGLTIIDDGAERSVDSGFIDITARDASGSIVVIELKAGAAGQRAVAQILSYMGDVATEEPGTRVRGILVASSFDNKAKAAARMVPNLSLRTYSVRFQFSTVQN
jgi:hypothetical protein